MVLLFIVSVNGVNALDDTNQTLMSNNDIGDDAILNVANDNVVNDSSSNEILTAGEGSFTELQEEVNNAINGDGVLTLTRDYVYDKVNDVSLRSGVVINAPLKIIGDGHTISGGDSLTTDNKNVISNDGARIFNINADDVSITNVNFKNGCLYYRNIDDYTSYEYLGAGIYWKGNDGVVDGCTFTDMVKYYSLGTTANTRADCVGLCIYHDGGRNFTVKNSNFSTSANLVFQSSAVYGKGMTGTFSILNSNFNNFYQMFESRYGDILIIKDCNFSNLPGEAYLWGMCGYQFNHIEVDNSNFNLMHAKNAGRTASNVIVFNSLNDLIITNSNFSTSARWQGTTIQGSEVYLHDCNFTNGASGGGETSNIIAIIGNNRATSTLDISGCYFYDFWASWYYSYYNSLGVSTFNNVKVSDTRLNNYAYFYFYNDNNVEFCYNEVNKSTRQYIGFNNVVSATVYNNTFDGTSRTFIRYGINIINTKVFFENNTFSNSVSSSIYDTGIFLQASNSNIVFNNNSFLNFSNNNMQGLYGIFQLASNVNCNFTNNIVDNYVATGIYSRGVFSNSGNLLLANNTFSKCWTVSSDSSGYGAVVYNMGTLVADNNTFSNIHSDYGGVIYSIGSVCNITNNTFKDCYATIDSGVCYTTTDKTIFINNTIINCYSNKDIGVLSINSANGIYNNNTFTNIRSTNKYGVILSDGSYNTFMYNTFTNITSGEKGAVALNTNNAFNHNNFTNITTRGEAGVFYVYGDDCNITNTIINNSTSVNDGGAIYSTGSNLNITNITINTVNSTRGFGGALYSAGQNLYINNMSVFNSKSLLSGGVLYSLATNVNISQINLINVSSDSSGGAIYCDGNDFNAYNINITNSIANIGGAIYCQSNNVLFDNLNVINSTANTGGAIYIVGNDVNIIDSTFTDCTATTGGAIYSSGSNGKLYNVIFNNINASSSGGALFWTGIDANFTEIVFNNITSTMGGAIYGSGTGAVFRDIIFDNVTASNSGGAIYWTGNGALLDTITFRTIIHSGANGGAIYWTGDKSRFKNMKFDNVTSDSSGGGIYSSASDCDLTNITFVNCSSDSSGGAIYWTGSNTNMSLLNFNNVNATVDGGAISLIAGNCKIYESNFTNIHAGSNGGAIYLIGDSSTLNDLRFSYCDAKYAGGAIYFVSSFSEIYNIYCLNNTAGTDGGAINFDGQNSKLYDSYFINNTASSNGGAISWISLNGILYNVNLTSNNALKGGALYWAANGADISFVNFTDNKADSDGGALFMGGFSSSNLRNSTFVNNSAENGGSVYWLSNNGVLRDSTFDGSSASNGGIVYWVGSNGNLLDVEFSGANASSSGGILFVEGNYFSFNNSVLSDSSALSGGAVYWIGHYGSINNISFINNTALSGGAFYLLGSDFKLNNSTFINNTANTSGGAVYWGGSGDLLKSNFSGNKAYSGSAIFNFASMHIEDSYFIKNKANISSIEIETKEEEQSFNVTATVYALDNFLNAIWTTSNNIEVNNVTYWDGLNMNNTGNTDITPSDEINPSTLYFSQNLANTNVVINIKNNKNGQESEVSGLTDINGVLKYSIPKSETTYNVTATHNEDDYYYGYVNSVTGFSGGYTSSITPLLSSYSFDYYSPISIMAIMVSSKMGQAAGPMNGTVHIYVDDEYLCDLNVTDAMGTLNTILLNDAGEHNLTMKYDGYGDENMTIYPCVSPTIYFTINKISLPLSVSVNSSSVYVGESININISSSEAYINGPIKYVIGNVENNAIYTNNFNINRTFNESGTVNVLVYADGNINYLPNVAHVSFNVVKNDVNIEILNLTGLYLESINVGDSVTINIKLDVDDATGSVILNLNDHDYVAPINGEYASVTIQDLESGFYPIIAKYYGDDKYYESNVVSAVLQVNKINIDDIIIIPTNHSILVGQEGVFDITVNPNSTNYKVNGYITVKINNKEFNVSIVNNTGSFTISNLEEGFYTIDVNYDGNAQFNSKFKSNVASLTVNKINISKIDVKVNNASILVGQDAVYNITVTPNETGYVVNGFVTVTVNNNDYNVSIVDGKGSLTVSGLPMGEYLADVYYAGDATFNNYGVTGQAKVNVNKLAIKEITVVAQNSSIYVGQDAVYNITVTPNAAGYVVNGLVTATINNKQYNVSISNGKGLLSVPGLTKGSYKVNVSYPGDATFAEFNVYDQANVVVNKVNINEINITPVSQSILVGQDAILNISVGASVAGYAVDGFVVVSVGGQKYNVSISNGKGSLAISGLLEGSYPVNISYFGDNTFNEFTANNKATISCNKANITSISVVPRSNNIFVGQDAVYDIDVTTNAADYVVNGFVTVTINGKNYNVSIINGKGSLIVSDLLEGNYSVNVTYPSDNTFNQFNVNNQAKVSVKKVPTTISITPVIDNILVGEDAVYTINVNANEPDYVVNGFVTVTVNGKNYNVSIINGKGSLTVSGLQNGTYFANIVYAGDSTFSASSLTNTGKVTVDVVSITGIVVSPERSSIYVGEDAVLDIEVMSNKFIVNGYVTIYVDSDMYNVSISEGKGSITIPNLSAGNHAVYVSYDYDGTFNKYNKTRVTSVNVNKVDILDMNITAQKSPIFVGEDANYVINITTNNGYTFNDFVTVLVNNKEYNVSISNGIGRFAVHALPEGTYSADVSYGGNNMYNSMYIMKVAPVTVNKVSIRDITVTAQRNSIFVGQNAVYSIDVIANETAYLVNGSVTVKLNNKEYIVPISDGKGSLNVSGLPEGSYTVDVTYAGDATFNSFNVTGKANVNVNKVNITNINVTPKSGNIYVGQNAVYDIVMTAAESGYSVNGFVTIKLNNKEYIVPITGGKGSLNVSGLSNATYKLNVSYAGDDTFNPIANNNIAQVAVHKVGINNIDVKVSTTPIYVGQDASYIINVTSKVAGYPVNGFVTIKINNKEQNVSIIDGIGRVSIPNLASGSYTMNVTYTGDDTFDNYSVINKGKVDVNKVNIKEINITARNSSIFVGQDAVYDINVAANTAGYVVNGYVTVSVGGKQYNVSISNGKGSLIVSDLTKGSYTANVSYAGDNIFNTYSVTNKAKVDVNNVNIGEIIVTPTSSTIFVGQSAVYNITVTTDNDDYVVNGFVTVNVAGNQYNVSIINGEGSIAVSGLNSGTHNIDVSYAGDDVFGSVANHTAATVTVNKVNTTIAVDLQQNSISVGENAIYTIHVISNVSGYNVNGFVKVIVDNKEYNVSINNGIGSLIIPNLANGTYNINVYYDGNDVFNSSSIEDSHPLSVNKVDIISIALLPNADYIYAGQSVIIDVEVSSAKYLVDGYVTVNVDNVDYNVSIKDGLGTLNVTNLSNGSHPVYVSFAGDDVFNAYDIRRAALITVYKVDIKNINITPKNDNVYVGEDVVYNINVTTNIPEYIFNSSIVLKVDGVNYNVPITNGIGSLTVSGLNSGVYTVDVSYPGDDIYNYYNDGYLAPVTVNKVPISAINIAPNINNIYAGQNAVYTINVIPAISSYAVNGSLKVKYDNKVITIPVINGAASLNVSNLTEGDYNIEIIFEGNNVFEALNNNTTLHVEKVNTHINVTGRTSIFAGENVIYDINVIADVPNYKVNGFVTVNIGDKYYIVPVTEGIGSCNVSGLAYGNYVLNVSYAGDNTFNPSANDSLKLTVNKLDTNIKLSAENNSIYVGQDAIFNINLTSPMYIVNGTVILNIDGKNYSVPINKGIGSLTVSGLANGTYNVKVSYGGDNMFNPSVNDTLKVFVNKVDTGVKVSVQNSSIFVGQDAVYLINVTANVPNYMVNGFVTLNINNKNYTVPITNGIGSCNVSGLANGTYAVNVTYAGDYMFNACAEKNKAPVTVNKVPIKNIIVDIESNNIFVGDDASFTITIEPDVDNYVVNGNVTLTVGDIDYNVSISNNIGSYIVSGLTNGTYNVKVSYDGDNTFTTLTNSSINPILVNKIPTSLSMDNITLNVGDVANIVAVINDTRVTGNVTFIVDDKNYVGAIIDGVATVSVVGLNTSCNSTISASYSGDYKFVNSSATAYINISKINGNVDLKVVDIVAGDVENVVIILPVDVSNATVSILFDEEPVLDYAVDNNIITFGRVVEVSGSYVVSVTVNDDVKYNNMAASDVFNVSKVNADDYEIAIDVNSSNVFDEIPVIVNLPADANGVLAIIVDDEIVNSSVPVVNGSASYVLGNLSSGTHNLSVSFENEKYGDKTFNTTVEILKLESDVIIDVPSDARVGKEMLININPIGSTGPINVTVNGKKYDVVNNTVNVSDLSAGVYTVMVYLDSDDNYLNSFNSSMFVVSLNDVSLSLDEVISPVLVDDTVVLRTVLSENVTGDVVFNINGVNYTVTIVDSDIAEFNFVPLKEGNVSVVASYLGSEVYSANVSDIVLFDVNRNNITFVDVNVSDIMFGDLEIIAFTLNASDADGITLISVGSGVYEASVVNGSAMISLSNLANGTYDVSIVYSGNSKYYESSVSNITFTVSKHDPALNITVKDIKVYDDETVIISLPVDATGQVSISVDNGTVVYRPIIEGIVVYNISSPNVGNHSVNVAYEGDSKYLNSSSLEIFEVSLYDSDMLVDYRDNIESTESLNITVSLPKDATGDVTLNIGGVNYTVPVDYGIARITVPKLDAGNYTGIVTYPGDDKYNTGLFEFDVNVEPDYIIIDAPDIIKYYSANESLVINLYNNKGTVLANKELYITINNVTYIKSTDDNGVAILDINLDSGVYDALIVYDQSDKYGLVENITNVTVLTTIHADNMTKLFGNASISYWAQFTDNEGNPLVNSTVQFNINGIFYTRTTNASGWAKLNINLMAGDYVITAYNLVTGEKHSNNITILNTIHADNLVKIYRNDSQYWAHFVDLENNSLVNTQVTFNINGVFYTRTTNASGWAKLNINLMAGDYVITAYNPITGEYYSNNITVLNSILANDLVKVYRNDSQYWAYFIDGDGNALANTQVTFNINGVFYTRSTNASGWAKLNINLIPGNYIITAYHPITGETVSNNIVVLPNIVENYDIVKKYKDPTKFTARIIADNGEPVGAGVSVEFNINGVFYTRTTNEDGYVGLNINLPSGEYIISTSYGGYVVSNTIRIIE